MFPYLLVEPSNAIDDIKARVVTLSDFIDEHSDLVETGDHLAVLLDERMDRRAEAAGEPDRRSVTAAPSAVKVFQDRKEVLLLA